MKLFEVIKNDGPSSALIHRFPAEDFLHNSTLIVQPGEQAVFLKNGTVHGIFDNGDYKLSTNNYPFLAKLRAMLSGGGNAFNCRVYFVRTSDTLNLRWWTTAPLQINDPVYDIALRVRGNGSYAVSINDAGLFLGKYAGNIQNDITPGGFTQSLQSEVLQAVGTVIRTTLARAESDIITSLADQAALAEKIRTNAEPVFRDYGVALERFSIALLECDEEDPAYVDLKKQRSEARGRILQARSQKEEMDILGARWEQRRRMDILETAAGNEGGGAGAVAGMGFGLGMGAAVGTVAGQAFAGTMQNAPGAGGGACAGCGAALPPNARFCPSCGKAASCTCGAAIVPGSKFCPVCGKPVA